MMDERTTFYLSFQSYYYYYYYTKATWSGACSATTTTYAARWSRGCPGHAPSGDLVAGTLLPRHRDALRGFFWMASAIPTRPLSSTTSSARAAPESKPAETPRAPSMAGHNYPPEIRSDRPPDIYPWRYCPISSRRDAAACWFFVRPRWEKSRDPNAPESPKDPEAQVHTIVAGSIGACDRAASRATN
ncbi:hypothetical protein SEVIR_9G235855v4 [Setaria viridis]